MLPVAYQLPDAIYTGRLDLSQFRRNGALSLFSRAVGFTVFGDGSLLAVSRSVDSTVGDANLLCCIVIINRPNDDSTEDRFGANRLYSLSKINSQ